MPTELDGLALQGLLLLTIQKVRLKIPDLSANLKSHVARYGGNKLAADQLDSRMAKLREEFDERVMIAKKSQDRIELKELYSLSYKTAKKHGIGDCGEISSAIFTKLFKLKIPKVDLVVVENIMVVGNHSFVTVGLPDPWHDMHVSQFPANVIIVDPWMQDFATMENKTTNGLYDPKDFSERLKVISSNSFSTDFDLAKSYLRLAATGETK